MSADVDLHPLPIVSLANHEAPSRRYLERTHGNRMDVHQGVLFSRPVYTTPPDLETNPPHVQPDYHKSPPEVYLGGCVTKAYLLRANSSSSPRESERGPRSFPQLQATVQYLLRDIWWQSTSLSMTKVYAELTSDPLLPEGCRFRPSMN